MCAAVTIVGLLIATSRLGHRGGSSESAAALALASASTKKSAATSLSLSPSSSGKNFLRLNDKGGEKDDQPWPRIAWLMSFPNSGTSYTLRLTQWSSNQTAASNYGDECATDPTTGLNIPLLPNSPVGPQIKFITKHSRPSRYVLTKTHCGGRCTHCDPKRYVETQDSFRVACLSGNRYVPLKGGKDGEVELIHEQRYSESLVKRAVHVIRDPFDNIVARFHLDWGKNKNDEEFIERYPSDPQGFRAWCKDMDDNYIDSERTSRFIDSDLIELLEQIPCHGDFFRYVQWHNLAVSTTAKMALPTYVLHYDEYSTNFNATMSDLMTFLELEVVAEPPEFVAGKTYRDDYYKTEEKAAALELIRRMANPETWELLERYDFI